jgi:aminocarboxymuconate-semialdehyde decarboxylase
MLIDMHSHYYGEALLAALEARTGRLPRVERDPDGTRFLVTPTARLPIGEKYVSLDARRAWMAETGIGVQLITFPGALGPDALPIAESAPLVAEANDELAAVSRAHPGVFPALAGLPLADMAEAARELERTVALGLVGAILPVNYFLDLGQLEKIRPVLEAANRVGAHLMVHPGPRADESIARTPWADLAEQRASTLALQDSLTHAAITLLYSDVAERYPDLSLQIVNLGGTLPFVLERLDHVAETRGAAGPRPSARLGGIHVDCASLGPRALGLAVEVFGAERVMLGTDYPIFATTLAQDAVRALPPDLGRQVGHETAAAILRRCRYSPHGLPGRTRFSSPSDAGSVRSR